MKSMLEFEKLYLMHFSQRQQRVEREIKLKVIHHVWNYGSCCFHKRRESARGPTVTDTWSQRGAQLSPIPEISDDRRQNVPVSTWIPSVSFPTKKITWLLFDHLSAAEWLEDYNAVLHPLINSHTDEGCLPALRRIAVSTELQALIEILTTGVEANREIIFTQQQWWPYYETGTICRPFDWQYRPASAS